MRITERAGSPSLSGDFLARQTAGLWFLVLRHCAYKFDCCSELTERWEVPCIKGDILLVHSARAEMST